MGLASLILGEQNPFAQFVAQNHNTIRGLGAGLASGQNFSTGLANAAQGAAAGGPADDAYAVAQKAEAERQAAIQQQAALRQKYAQFFLKQNQPQYAQAVADGIMEPGAAYGDWMKSTMAQKSNPQYFNMGNGTLVEAQDGSAKPIYTAPSPVTPDMPSVSFTDAGVPDPQQQAAFLQQLDPQFANIVKGVANYELDPTRITSLRGDQRQKLIEAAKAYDPSFDMSQFPARSAMRKSITSGTYSQTLNSANLVIQHLDELKKAGEALHNQGGLGTLLNAPANIYKGMTGDPTITRFDEAKQAVGAELAKVFKGSGVSDVGSIEEWKNTFNNANSPEQMQQAIATAVALLKSRIDTIQNQYQSAMGKPANFAYLTPHSKQVLNDLGIDPSALDPAAQQQGGGTASVDDLVTKYLGQ